MAMSVNMLGARFTTEAHPRWKNGQPPQSTTGVASNHSTQFFVEPVKVWGSDKPGIISAMARSMTKREGPRQIQNRRVISSSSGFPSSTSETTLGSSAIPQIRQAPGLVSNTSGSIGQMYSTTPPDGTGMT